jgi:hypothetical protein
MNIIQTIKKYPKDTLITVAVIMVGLLAVSSDGFSDFAQKKFWWIFWEVVSVLSILACFFGWLYLKSKDKTKK